MFCNSIVCEKTKKTSLLCAFQNMIDSLSEHEAKRLLKALTATIPSVILDVADEVSRKRQREESRQLQLDETEATTGSSKTQSDLPVPNQHLHKDPQALPSWCVCQHCREMPTEWSKVCCGMRPDLCTSLMPVSVCALLTSRTETVRRHKIIKF